MKDFDELDLMQTDAARLLSVNIRAVRLWAENLKEITESPKQAWRPDGVDAIVRDQDELAKQITKYLEHAIQLIIILKKVENRCRPAMQ